MSWIDSIKSLEPFTEHNVQGIAGKVPSSDQEYNDSDIRYTVRTKGIVIAWVTTDDKVSVPFVQHSLDIRNFQQIAGFCLKLAVIA